MKRSRFREEQTIDILPHQHGIFHRPGAVDVVEGFPAITLVDRFGMLRHQVQSPDPQAGGFRLNPREQGWADPLSSCRGGDV